MKTFTAVGMDVGFRKTGLAFFQVSAAGDELVDAVTVCTGDDVADSVLAGDVLSCLTWCERVDGFMAKHSPVLLFAEVPHGGAQGARANRCMGMATALAAAYLHSRLIQFEIYSPHDVEKALGVVLPVGEGRKLSKGDRTAWKKSRLAKKVSEAWPGFKAWPSTKRLREDATDAAAAYLCGRLTSELYKTQKKLLLVAT